MTFLNFTAQEIRVLLLLLAALLVGSGISYYKRTHPQFAPELVTEKADLATIGIPEAKPPSVFAETPPAISLPRKQTRVNINRATAEELETVPGLGPKLSQRIIEYRKLHGPFKKLDDLVNVRGIGPKSLSKIADHLAVE